MKTPLFCSKCKKLIQLNFKTCPYCSNPVNLKVRQLAEIQAMKKRLWEELRMEKGKKNIVFQSVMVMLAQFVLDWTVGQKDNEKLVNLVLKREKLEQSDLEEGKNPFLFIKNN